MRSPCASPAGRVARQFGLSGLIVAAAFAFSADALLASTDPSSNGPQELVSLVKSCWENRDAERYRDLFTEDFRFTYADESSNLEWGRAEELAVAASLFGPGTGSQPGATNVALTYEGEWNPGSIFLAEKPYPWHQQVLVPNALLRVTRSDGSILTAQGSTLFFLVRGDSAAIPQELRDRGFTADSTRWYVERWEDTPLSVVVDHAPVVLAPPAWSGSVGSQISIDITASDPDGDPIATLSSSGATGAKFIHNADNTTGWFSWFPQPADVGTHAVTFLASNRLPGHAVTTIQVLPPEGPVASLVATPAAGNAPLTVVLDASGSIDPTHEPIVSYRFEFGDGSAITQTTPIASHNYAGGKWSPIVSVTNRLGKVGRATADVDVNFAPIARVDFSPKAGKAPLVVAFDASSSRDPDGTIVRYKFRFGDGDSVSQATPLATHTYTAQGQWTGAIVVTDDRGQSSVAPFTVLVDVDHPPVVTAPATLRVKVDRLVVIRVSASDEDGDAIQSLTAQGPNGASFVVAPDQRSATLSWTPGTADLGVHTVTFTASNALTGLARTLITVSAEDPEPNLATNPSFELGTQGWKRFGDAALEQIPGGHEGDYALQVTGWTTTMTSFGINDQPNVIYGSAGPGIRYRYTAWVRSPSVGGTSKLMVHEFSVLTGAQTGEAISVPVRLTTEWQMLTLDYVTTAGNTTLSFEVRDYAVTSPEILIVDDITVTLVSAQEVALNLAPNPSFEVDTQGWKTYASAVLERVPSGHEGLYSLRVSGSSAKQSSFGINDSPNIVYRSISAGIRYRFAAWVRSPSAQGTAKLIVQENSVTTDALLGELRSVPVPLTPDWQMLTLDYMTTAENTTLSLQVRDFPVVPSEVFLIDDISVRNVTGPGAGTGMAQGPRWADEDAGSEPHLAPNPMRERGWLRFGTTETGSLRVDVLDVAGRRVRRLFEDWSVPAGVHELVVPSVDETGARLGAGVYFYRIETKEGVRIGRFVVLRQ